MRILVADQNSLLLAAITATFGRHCDVFTATRRDACLAQVEQHRFDVVIACDKLADYTGLELLSEVPVISPDTLLIFAADPKRLSQLGKRLAVFGLFDTLSYPLTPQNLVDVLKRARECLGARSHPKVRHVVLESEWDTGERLGMVERELQSEGRAETHEEWEKASEIGAAEGGNQADDDADDFVFAGPPPAVQAMAAPPRAAPDSRSRTFEATPVPGVVTQYEVKPATPAVGHESGGADTSQSDGAEEFVFAVEPDPVAALRESRIEIEGATVAKAEEPREPSPDELCSNDPVFEVQGQPRWAEDGAANDIAFQGRPVEPASWRRGGTGSLPRLTRDIGTDAAAGPEAQSSSREPESRGVHARTDRAPASVTRVERSDARGDARSPNGRGSAAANDASRSQHTDSGRASNGAGSADAKTSQGHGSGRSPYLEAALAANIAAHANFGKTQSAARSARDGAAKAPGAQVPNSGQSAHIGLSSQAATSAGLGRTSQTGSAQSSESAERAESQPSESPQASKSAQGGTVKTAKAPSSKASPQPRVRAQAVPTAAQLAAFERAVARKNAGETNGSDDAPVGRRGRKGAGGGPKAAPSLVIEKFDDLAGAQPSKSLSELAKMASTKRPLGTPGLNKVVVPKRTMFAVSSGLAVLILGVLSFELLRNSSEAEHHMPHAQTQPQSVQVFSSTTMLANRDENNAAQLVAPPPPAEAPPMPPPQMPIQPQAIEYDPNTAPPDPPPPPVLEHPEPTEPAQPPYTRGYTGSVVDGVPQNPDAQSQ